MRPVRPGIVAAALLTALAGCSSTARTLEEGADVNRCERCHGFPPAAPHPTVASDAAACNVCHSDTVDPAGNIIAGGAHENGNVDVTIAHPIPYVAQHPPEALANIQSCKACHGNDYNGGTAPSCTACHATTPGIASWTTNCTFCHGARTAGVTTATAQAAPPQSVVVTADQTNANPKVGAHQTHLSASGLAPAMPCASCHSVPTQAEALTHFTGNGAPGAISFSAVATKGVSNAAYTGGTCNVYCHGAGTEFTDPAGPTLPAWTSGVACGDCHAGPSAPPASGPTVSGQPAHLFHIAQTLNGQPVTCATCHPALPAQHVNGTKDVVVRPSAGGPVTITGGWNCSACHDALGIGFVHGTPFVDQHTSFALADLNNCTSCHGADFNGATGVPSCNACHSASVAASAPDWKTNCTFCHGTRTAGVTTATPAAAPPQSVVVTADQTTSNPRIGAHQKHLGVGATLSNGVACTECHPAVTGLTHFGSGTATIAFGPLATTGGSPATRTGLTCANYCHGATLPGTGRPAPTWAPPTAMTCGSCHAAAPTSGQHTLHRNVSPQNGGPILCSACHGAAFVQNSAVDKALHVDGAINKTATVGWQAGTRSCAPLCHGGETW